MAAAFDYMHCGDLVPDSTVRKMLRERSGRLLVLDGSPRTLGQAEALSQLMERESRAKCRGELRIGCGGNRVSPERPPDSPKVQGGLSRHEAALALRRHLR